MTEQSKEILTAIEQKEIDFYGDELIAIRANDGQIYVSVRHMCSALGIDRRGQMRKLEGHDLLNEGLKSICAYDEFQPKAINNTVKIILLILSP